MKNSATNPTFGKGLVQHTIMPLANGNEAPKDAPNRVLANNNIFHCKLSKMNI
jgi:hypothetical protein